MTLCVVVMGVSGCGKSTLGAALANALGARFVDADDLHPAANIAKMRAGIPLNDADRAPWLDLVARVLELDAPVIVACSALRRAYRDRLRLGCPKTIFVHPTASADVLATRLNERRGHFMPPGLLASQLATLQPPAPDEAAVTVSVSLTVAAQVAQVLPQLAKVT